MRRLLLFLVLFVLFLWLGYSTRGAEPFEIKEGDRVLFLGDTLLEREGTYGYLETRMHEQFPDRHFTVRNLSWSGETPRGWSRASFDSTDKGWERLKENIAGVRPTVVFLGFGMAASLQEMTDRSGDITLNPDPKRYGEEPMSAARFKKELGELMDAIAKDEGGRMKDEEDGGRGVGKAADPKTSSASTPLHPSSFIPHPSPVRFVLLSPIRHEDLRAVKPGLPDPAEHNKLLEQYSKAIEELAKERGGRFLNALDSNDGLYPKVLADREVASVGIPNGIHLSGKGYNELSLWASRGLQWNKVNSFPKWVSDLPPSPESHAKAVEYLNLKDRYLDALRAAVIRKNELFFHQFRPANSTYLFGFRKHEQGQNAKEMPMFDPLIAAAEAEIDRLKSSGAAATAVPGRVGVPPAGSGVSPERTSRPTAAETNAVAPQLPREVREGGTPSPAGGTPTLPGPIPGTPPPLPDFTVADGYQIELWAQNPLLEKPTQMNWDPQGRLWVCSSSLYPQIEPGQPANDKILILSDTDGDGKADKSEVFVDGLLIPTGVAPDVGVPALAGSAPDSLKAGLQQGLQQACYVGQSTELLHFTDTDGDGRADTKRIVFSGFGTEDTHHIVHTLHWGPDGRLYFHQSVYIHSHLETPWGMVRLNSGGVFAYDPRTERVEVFAKGLWNTWGQAEDDWGQTFLTDGAGRDGISWAFPGATFAPFEGSRRQMPSVSPGSYPKFAGLEIVKSPHFPADWQGNMVTCDFRAHRIVRFAIKDEGGRMKDEENGDRAGGTNAVAPANPSTTTPSPSSSSFIPHPSSLAKSGYTTTEQPDLVRTTDLSFRPIDVRLGPDGALYVADWSNPVINHGEVDFRDPRRDHHMGRIWRITKKGAPLVKWEALRDKDTGELMEMVMSSPSGWEREQALRGVIANNVSIDLQNGRVVSAIHDEFLRQWNPAKETDAERARFEWMMFACDSGFGAMKELSREGTHGARAAMARLAGTWISHSLLSENVEAERNLKEAEAKFSADEIARMRLIETPFKANVKMLAGLTADASPRVRLEAMRALARIPTAESASLVLDAALKTPGVEQSAIRDPQSAIAPDPHYDFAAWQSINDLAKPWTDALASGAWKTEGREAQLAYGLKAIDPALAGAAFSKLFAAGKVPLDGPWIDLMGEVGGPVELQRLLDGLLAGFVGDCCETDETRALDPKLAFTTPVAIRAIAALQTAARVRNARPAAHSELVTALFHTNGEIGMGAIRLAGLWKAPDAVAKIGELIDARETNPTLRRAAVDGLRSAGGPAALGFLRVLTRAEETSDTRAAALVATAQIKLDAGIVLAAEVLPTFTDEAVLLGTWRGLLGVKGAADAFALKFGKQEVAKSLPPPVLAAAVRAAREVGKPGAPLLAALAPFTGGTANLNVSHDYADLAVQAKRNGDPVKGELIYRRATSACVTCHAIGGAGGKVGPDMTSIGASAPLDYLIESILAPAAKVKEGYNAVALTLLDGEQVTGIQSRESANEVFLRDAAGTEKGIPKAQIKAKTDIGSMMPPGLTATLKTREAFDLYVFLSELGKPGPYDASKGTVARVWRMYPGTAAGEVVSATYDPAKNPGFPGYTLVDGRFVKDLLTEATTIAAAGSDTVLLATQFQSSGKTRLNLTGATTAWLDAQPLALGTAVAPELPNGTHTLVVKIGVKELPEVLRAESPDARFLGN